MVRLGEMGCAWWTSCRHLDWCCQILHPSGQMLRVLGGLSSCLNLLLMNFLLVFLSNCYCFLMLRLASIGAVMESTRAELGSTHCVAGCPQCFRACLSQPVHLFLYLHLPYQPDDGDCFNRESNLHLQTKFSLK